MACPNAFPYVMHGGLFCCSIVMAINDNGGLIDMDDTLDKCDPLLRYPCPLGPHGSCYSQTYPEGSTNTHDLPSHIFSTSFFLSCRCSTGFNAVCPPLHAYPLHSGSLCCSTNVDSLDPSRTILHGDDKDHCDKANRILCPGGGDTLCL